MINIYSKKIEVEAPLAKERFLLITNYDKLLHVSLTFVSLSFLYPVSIMLSIIAVGGLQILKELLDYYLGDELIDVIYDLIADVIGWLLFGLYLLIIGR